MRYFLRWALFHETFFAIKYMAMILYYFVSLRFVHSKRRRSSFWRTLMLVKEAAIEANLDRVAKKILLTSPGLRILIMGHSHGYRSRYYGPDKLYINSGTWTERVSLDPANFGRIVQLTYVLIDVDEEDHAQATLKEWVGTHEVSRDIQAV
jgi:UDP-2,3-diacylglucosamine pyrophosphatase LpxH